MSRGPILLLDRQSEALRRSVWLLAWPAIVEMLLHMMVGIVDTAMVGRLGPDALASVGLANQIFQLGTTIFAAIATGSTALVARHIGAQQPRQAANAAAQSLLLGLAVAGVVSVALITWALPLLGFLFRGTDPAVLALSTVYIRMVASVLVLHFFFILTNGTLRGAGDTKTPMRITAIVNVINVVGNYLLIFGIGPFPALGVQGAAIATAVSHSVGGLLALNVLFRKSVVPVHFRDLLRLDLTMIRRIVHIGVPAAFEQSTMRIGQLLYTMIVASLGTAAYAAHQVALNAESISFMPGFGFSLAATTLVGQNLGAQDPDRAEKSGIMSNQMAMAVMSFMGIVFFVFPEYLVAIFTNDPEVTALATLCLRIIAISQPALATIMVLAGGLRGAGDTKSIMKITLWGFCIVRLGLAYVLAITLDLGLMGAWIAMAIDLFFRGYLLRRRFLGGQWKNLKI